MSELMNSRRPFDRLFRLSQPVKTVIKIGKTVCW